MASAPSSPTNDQVGCLVDLMNFVACEDPPAWELLERGADGLARLTGDACIASLLSDDGRWLHPLGFSDPDPRAAAALEALTRIRLDADRGFTREVLSTCRAVRLCDTTPEILRAGRPELGPFVAEFGLRSLIVAPMRARGRPMGHVALLRRRPGAGPLDEHDERNVQLVADWCALGLSAATSRGSTVGLPATDIDPSMTLSEREREVLALLGAGHTNREIGERLVLSVRTIEWHRARIQWKLGVSGRAALIEAARAGGLLDVGP